VEHRLFSHITMNWRGRPLISHDVVINSIATTTTRTGLTVQVVAVAQAAAKQAPGDPAVPALGVGAVTWLLLTGRLDLAPCARR
jgi:hypothetical protein